MQIDVDVDVGVDVDVDVDADLWMLDSLDSVYSGGLLYYCT